MKHKGGLLGAILDAVLFPEEFKKEMEDAHRVNMAAMQALGCPHSIESCVAGEYCAIHHKENTSDGPTNL